MKRLLYLLLPLLLIAFTSNLMAQDETPPIPPAALEAAAEPMPASDPTPMTTFRDVVLSSGVLGVLIWLGILCWGIATVPLGLVSIISSVKARTALAPLTFKILVFGAVCVVLLGCLGFTQGMIFSFYTLATMAPSLAQQNMLYLNIAHALYSISAALMVCHINLLFILPTIIILHLKRKQQDQLVAQEIP